TRVADRHFLSPAAGPSGDHPSRQVAAEPTLDPPAMSGRSSCNTRRGPSRSPHAARAAGQGPPVDGYSQSGEDGCDSPHPCAIHGAVRPAKRPDSTALGRRSLIRMRPLVQVQPGPLRRFDLGKRSSLPLRSWLLPCVAFAQRSENTSLHSSTGANGLPRLTSGTPWLCASTATGLPTLAGLACGCLEAEVGAPAEGPNGNCSHS